MAIYELIAKRSDKRHLLTSSWTKRIIDIIVALYKRKLLKQYLR